MVDTFNYWTDRITFKDRLANVLAPKLKAHIGKTVSKTLMDEITAEVGDFATNNNDDLGWIFTCNVSVECKKTTADGKEFDIVRNVSVEIIDI